MYLYPSDNKTINPDFTGYLLSSRSWVRTPTESQRENVRKCRFRAFSHAFPLIPYKVPVNPLLGGGAKKNLRLQRIW